MTDQPARTPWFVAFLLALVLTLVPDPVHAAAAGETESDADDAPASATPTLDDLAFMTGVWHADWQGNRLEEHYGTPSDGTMIGMFRWTSDGATLFTEHLVLEQRDDGVHFLLRHFDPGGAIWEQEADGPMAFRLESVRDGRAAFVADREFPSHLIYHRTQPDTMVVRLEGRRPSGEPREMEFVFRRTSMSTTTETLTEVGHALGYDGGLTVAFQTKDLSKSIDWYQNVLGFKLMYHLEEMGWCELTTGVDKVNVGLSQVEAVKPGGPTPTFGVKDIDHARAQLEAKGVKFDGETIEIPNMVKLATFFDPDGNSLMFFQSLSDQMP